jgi:restriction system protein
VSLILCKGVIMSLPDFQSLMLPFLRYSADGKEKNIGQAIEHLSNEFNLTPEEREATVPSGKNTIISNRIHWARTYLDKAGLIRRTRRSHFEITDRGKKLLASNPGKINTSMLRQFPEFVEFQSPKKSEVHEFQFLGKGDVGFQEETITPEEAIYASEKQINNKLSKEIIERIGDMSPSFFEQLVVDLVVAMGYGGSREIVAQRIGRSGDEGIDGIVNEDPLGLDIVYIQAKRYREDNVIGREKLQQFSGALVGQSANKGVFVTTSDFTKGAREYVEKIPQRIILINGQELASLMLRYGVGVRTERKVEIKRIDADYFEEDGD